MKKFIFVSFVLVSVSFLFVACDKSAGWANAETLEGAFNNKDGTSSPKINLELALTNQQRQVGLMYRKSMPETSGMLFVFPDNARRSFWMKNTYIALDMIFVRENLTVDSIVYNATPLTTSQRASKGAAKYVVEVRAGLAKKWGIIPDSVFTPDEQIPDHR